MRLFGPMEVRVGGRPIPRLRSRKGQWLLALLALRSGSDVDRGWLAGTLWPECLEADSLRSLRQSLHDLRSALGPEGRRVASEGMRALRLDLSGAVVDGLEFDAALRRGDPGSLEAAVRLYRAPFLEGCAEEWALPERAAREQSYLQALARLAASTGAQGQHGAAAGYLRRAVSTDPYREDLQRALMQELGAAGRQAEALLVYRDFRSLLLREMATEPAEETASLFQRLRDEARVRAARPSPVSPPAPAATAPRCPASAPRSLPRPLTVLIGREEDARDVIRRLVDSRLVTLTGAGGVGKTRLALRVAEELAGEYEDGAAFVDLSPLSDAGDVPGAVLAALGAPSDPHEEPLETVRRHLTSRRMLLVLDNCEHLLDSSASLAEVLISTCAGVRILATSRQSLGIGGEAVWRVPSLLVPPGSQLGEASLFTLHQYPAVRLFAERARASNAAFEITACNAAAVTQVCGQLDGIPLAIELAAARVRAMPVEQIAARLDDRFRLLTGGARTAPHRQQTLRASIEWSCDLLSPAERLLMERLSVFAGGWTLEAAEAVCAGDPLPEREIMELLLSLVDKSLVVYEERGAAARYRMLETVRQYARDRLRGGGEGEAAHAAHLHHFVSLTEQAEPHLVGADQREWLDRLEVEHDNLRTALDWAVSSRRDPEAGVRLAAGLFKFWEIRGHLKEGRERLSSALACASCDPSTSRARALSAAGAFAHQQGDYAAARALHEESLAIFTQLGERRAISMSLNNLAVVAAAEGDYARARALKEEVLANCVELGERRGIAMSLNNLGTLRFEIGDYAAAREILEQSVAISRELGNRRGLGMGLSNLGFVSLELGDYESARALLEESLTMRRELGERGGVSRDLCGLGRLTLHRGDPPAARALFEEALAIGRDLGDRLGMANCLEEIAAVEAALENPARAALLWGAGEGLREEIRRPRRALEAARREEILAGLRSALGDAELEREMAAGRAMSLDRAIDGALSEARLED